MNPSESAAVVEMLDDPVGVGREEIEEYSPLPLKFFHLTCHPFSDNVNPRFFYRTGPHEDALIAMKHCIEEDISLGLTTAVSGTGKTLLTQVLLQELEPERYKPALVLIYPRMSRTAMLREICTELGIEDIGARPTMHQLVNTIQQEIMDLYIKGIKLVVIIDECHFLTADNLQILRTLSNIEIPQKKLVTILLFGEDNFNDKLRHPRFKSILNRTFTRTRLRALTEDEIEQYVKFRLLMADGRTDTLDPGCFTWLEKASQGIPREVNRICHNALRVAAARSQRRISPDLLEDVEKDNRL